MAALPGKTVALGNPPSSSHQVSPVELADWMENIESEAAVPYANRALAQAATINASVDRIWVSHDGSAWPYERDANGTALTTGGGDKWSPASFAPATPQHWGAVGDASANAQPAVQAALDWAELTGRDIFAPAGKYLLNNQIDIRFTTLRGEGWHFDPMLVTDEDDLFGTVFICNFATGTAESLVNLNSSGRIEDVLLYNNSLQADATRPPSWNPTATPWAITSGDFNDNDRDVRQAHSGARNVVFLEFTHGIRLNKGGERGVFKQVYGNPLRKGLEVHGNYDLTRFEDLHFWPFGGNTGAWQDNEKDYTFNNLEAFRIGRVDGLIMSGCFTIGAAYGIRFVPNEDTLSLGGTATIDAKFTDCYIDAANRCFVIDGTYSSGWGVSAWFSNCTFQHFDSSGGGPHYTTEGPTIDVDSRFGTVTFDNCRITSSASSRVGTVVDVDAAEGRLVFNDCIWFAWDEGDSGSPNIEVTGNADVEVNGGRVMSTSVAPMPYATFTGKTWSKGNVRTNNLTINASRQVSSAGLSIVDDFYVWTSGEGHDYQIHLAQGTADSPSAVADNQVIKDETYRLYYDGGYAAAGLFRTIVNDLGSVASVTYQFLAKNASDVQTIPMQVEYDRVTMVAALIQGDLRCTNLPEHADEAAATTAGLVSGTVYQTATGELRIKL